MPCRSLDVMGTTLNIADYLVFPTTCFYYFWAIMFFALFALITFFLFNREREDLVKADLISSMGVAATAIFFLAIIGTLVTATNGIPLLQRDIFLYILAFWVVIVAVWIFKR